MKDSSLDSLASLKISQIRAFVAVAATQNFSTAALDLGLSQSTVSHAIATLESALGVALLNRGRFGATLTPTGADLLPEAQQILQLLDTLQAKAIQARTLQRGDVRVSCVRSIAAQVLPDIMARFKQSHPHIRITLTERDRYAQIEQALRDGDIDVGFTVLPAGPEFDVWDVCRDEFVAVLPPGSIDAAATLDWDTLLAYPMIMNPAIAPIHLQRIEEHLSQFGYTLSLDYEVKQDTTILGMVQKGLGATIMPRMTAEPLPPGVLVKPLPVPLERVTGVAILASALHAPAVFDFVQVAREIGRGAPVPS